MTNKELLNAMGNVKPEFIMAASPDAVNETRRQKKDLKYGAATITVILAAACVCLCFKFTGKQQTYEVREPKPEFVQVVNPMLEVESAEKMAEYLDFNVPVMSKDVKKYYVFVDGGYPAMGQINYSDGSSFRIKYGEEDISGIYGGKKTEQIKIGKVLADCYVYDETYYAVWTADRYSFCYVAGEGKMSYEGELKEIINIWENSQKAPKGR